jgi:hypothetical protein
MNKENGQNNSEDQPSSGEAANPSASAEMMLVRRPRPGAVVILAPPGTRMLWSSSKDSLRLELRDRSRE